jgi:hypothetical protein
MGLIKHLLFWPVTGPNFLAKFALDKVGDTVREELTNDQSVKEDLLSLQMRLELGEIDDEQYLIEEAEVMQRLREVRQWREEFGMGTSGGPVRVAGSASAPRAAEAADAGGSLEPADTGSPLQAPADSGIALPRDATVEVRFDFE